MFRILRTAHGRCRKSTSVHVYLGVAIVSAAPFLAARSGPRRWHPGYRTSRRSVCSCADSSKHTIGLEDVLPGGACCTEHFFRVPLDYTALDDTGDERVVTVFAREIVLQRNKGKAKTLPVLLYLQGGPGFPSARPMAASGGWLERALQDHRVILLDQRGTGRSTPVTPQTLENMSSREQVSYLSHFRADSIVRDCEEIRRALDLEKISLLGQSFGGFCALTYLSFFPESLSAVYITGGLGPIFQTPEEVYRATYRRMIERNRRYYDRYPGDIAKVRRIVSYLEEKGGVTLPSGGRLTARRFLSLGLALGSGSGMETMHWLVEDAFVNIGGRPELDMRFLAEVDTMQSFETNPIYWLLHEAIYCGPGIASRWAAHRVLGEPQFQAAFNHRDILAKPAQQPILFTGEMVYPWFSEDFARLKTLADAAEELAYKNDWPELYNKVALRGTSVPVAAAVYYEDVYVEREFSLQVASLLGDKCKVWITNEFQHSGLRDDGGRVFGKLLKMLSGEINIPS